ncbi:PQQ-dependent sugar dehydrogenase [Parasphingopyxis sp. CP4]|uniref:PQQ-dependent sugar dehydrogenase n=1 Tax=Parasphingopyxis sp. CP4 TaxID=2724527 RepID=UPI0015A36332|nr:PQQ-dependent sugar dehydrogenase [Parasphingopyxis sp. CP4]QLC22246.1 PQQ-dependent sugar dehydrogenase [Parasphingopyxis sp. CP4]
MRTYIASLSVIALAACSAAETVSAQESDAVIAAATETFSVEEVATFNEPWAMAFLPDGRALVTEKSGTMRLWSPDQETVEVSGIPAVDYGGQGGLGDVTLHPDFAENGMVYFSYAEAGDGETRAAVVARGILVVAGDDSASLNDVEVIWRQGPKTGRRGHYGHRILFGPEGYLFIASGDRQELEPAQDTSNNLGTVVRLNADGSVPDDNPFADQGGMTAEIWSYGHRNPLGFAFDTEGQLWDVEHGPAGGDELNRIERSVNYGWPTVSNGEHYDGRPIPDHDTDARFRAPYLSWTPVIAPGGMIFYSGDMFADLTGDLLIAGLSTNAIIHVEIDGETAREAGRFTFDNRIREIEQGPNGTIWILEDGEDGRMIRLTAGG